MTDKRERFIEEYLKDFNGAAAARRAGYSEDTAKQEAYKLLRTDEVKKAIEERLDILSMSSAEATKRLSDWARGSFEPFIKEDKDWGLILDLSNTQAKENLHLIKKMKQTKKVYYNPVLETNTTEYSSEIELHDAKDATVQIAKIRGLYVERSIQDITIKKSVKELSDDELAAIAAANQA